MHIGIDIERLNHFLKNILLTDAVSHENLLFYTEAIVSMTQKLEQQSVSLNKEVYEGHSKELSNAKLLVEESLARLKRYSTTQNKSFPKIDSTKTQNFEKENQHTTLHEDNEDGNQKSSARRIQGLMMQQKVYILFIQWRCNYNDIRPIHRILHHWRWKRRCDITCS
jgi:hypothetical protein